MALIMPEEMSLRLIEGCKTSKISKIGTDYMQKPQRPSHILLSEKIMTDDQCTSDLLRTYYNDGIIGSEDNIWDYCQSTSETPVSYCLPSLTSPHILAFQRQYTQQQLPPDIPALHSNPGSPAVTFESPRHQEYRERILQAVDNEIIQHSSFSERKSPCTVTSKMQRQQKIGHVQGQNQNDNLLHLMVKQFRSEQQWEGVDLDSTNILAAEITHLFDSYEDKMIEDDLFSASHVPYSLTSTKNEENNNTNTKPAVMCHDKSAAKGKPKTTVKNPSTRTSLSRARAKRKQLQSKYSTLSRSKKTDSVDITGASPCQNVKLPLAKKRQSKAPPSSRKRSGNDAVESAGGIRKRRSIRQSHWQKDPKHAEQMRAAVWEIRFLKTAAPHTGGATMTETAGRYKIPIRTLRRYRDISTGKTASDPNDIGHKGVMFEGKQPLPPHAIMKYVNLGSREDFFPECFEEVMDKSQSMEQNSGGCKKHDHIVF